MVQWGYKHGCPLCLWELCLATENFFKLVLNSASCSPLPGQSPNVSLDLVWANSCLLGNGGVIHKSERFCTGLI